MRLILMGLICPLEEMEIDPCWYHLFGHYGNLLKINNFFNKNFIWTWFIYVELWYLKFILVLHFIDNKFNDVNWKSYFLWATFRSKNIFAVFLQVCILFLYFCYFFVELGCINKTSLYNFWKKTRRV